MGAKVMTLKDMRLKSGLKVEKIFSELGISRSGLYYIESGRTMPDKLKIERLSLLYGQPVEEIVKAWEVNQ